MSRAQYPMSYECVVASSGCAPRLHARYRSAALPIAYSVKFEAENNVGPEPLQGGLKKSVPKYRPQDLRLRFRYRLVQGVRTKFIRGWKIARLFGETIFAHVRVL